MEKNLQNIIDETLNSLDHMQRAETMPFFHTRLMARIEKEKQAEKVWLHLHKPVLVIAVLTILLLMNGLMITRQFNATGKGNAPESSSLHGFASEYGLTVSSNNY